MSCCSVSFRSYWRFNVKFGNLMTKHGYSFRLCCFRKSVVLRCGYSLRARRQGALAQQLPRAARSSEYSSEDLCFLVDFGWLLVFSSLFPSQKVQKEFKLEFAKRHFCGWAFYKPFLFVVAVYTFALHTCTCVHMQCHMHCRCRWTVTRVLIVGCQDRWRCSCTFRVFWVLFKVSGIMIMISRRTPWLIFLISKRCTTSKMHFRFTRVVELLL